MDREAYVRTRCRALVPREWLLEEAARLVTRRQPDAATAYRAAWGLVVAAAEEELAAACRAEELLGSVERGRRQWRCLVDAVGRLVRAARGPAPCLGPCPADPCRGIS
eukprot:m51a1_g11157 hypothetical protein (108) ;mRNA; f:279474-279862